MMSKNPIDIFYFKSVNEFVIKKFFLFSLFFSYVLVKSQLEVSQHNFVHLYYEHLKSAKILWGVRSMQNLNITKISLTCTLV